MKNYYKQKVINYKKYVDAQIKKNREKFDKKSVKGTTLAWIAKHKGKDVEGVLCHGVRNGREMRKFRTFYPEADIVGTDIADTILDVEEGIQWDFHEVNPMWDEGFEIIYSNSLDHSFDPNLAISTWKQALERNGTMYVEWSAEGHSEDNPNDFDEADCFQASLGEYVDLFRKHFTKVEVKQIDSITHLVVSSGKKY